MTVDMNGFKEMVQELIEDGNLDVLEMMRETVSKARRTVKSNKKKEEKKKANGQKIQERIKRMSEGVVITSAKETDSEITVRFKNEELVGRFISVTQNGATVFLDGERKVIPFYQVVA